MPTTPSNRTPNWFSNTMSALNRVLRPSLSKSQGPKLTPISQVLERTGREPTDSQ